MTGPCAPGLGQTQQVRWQKIHCHLSFRSDASVAVQPPNTHTAKCQQRGQDECSFQCFTVREGAFSFPEGDIRACPSITKILLKLQLLKSQNRHLTLFY